MTAPESHDAQSGVAEVLLRVAREHQLIAITGGTAAGAQWICRCDAQQINPGGRDYAEWMHARHAAHYLAAAIEPLLAAERAKAWDEAIHEAEACGWLHDLAADDMAGRNPHHRADREQP